MKKIIITLLTVAAITASCKNEEKPVEKEVEETTTLKANPLNKNSLLQGEYIYTEEAAVLKGSSFIYGVKLDSMAQVLANKVESFKREDYDMVPVIVKGLVTKNSNKEGWEEIVEIKEIIKVSEPTSEAAIKVKGE